MTWSSWATHIAPLPWRSESITAQMKAGAKHHHPKGERGESITIQKEDSGKQHHSNGGMTRSGFLKKSKIREVLMCKSRFMLKLTRALRDWCDVRAFCVKMVISSRLVDLRRPRACLRRIRIKREVKRLRVQGKRCGRKMDCVWPRKIQNADVDNDVIEVFSVSSGSDVVPSFAWFSCALWSPDWHRVHVCSVWSAAVCISIRGKLWYASGIHIPTKEAKDMLHQQGGSPLVRSSGMSASERMIVLRCPAGAPEWMEQPGSGFWSVETGGRGYRISQPDLQYNSGRREKSGGPHLRSWRLHLLRSLGRRRLSCDLGIRVNPRRKGRIVRRKRTSLLGFAEKMEVWFRWTPFNPLMSGLGESDGDRLQGSLTLQATRVPEQGRLVREQIAHAPRMTEQAEQTFRASRAFEKGVMSRSAQRIMTKGSTLFQETSAQSDTALQTVACAVSKCAFYCRHQHQQHDHDHRHHQHLNLGAIERIIVVAFLCPGIGFRAVHWLSSACCFVVCRCSAFARDPSLRKDFVRCPWDHSNRRWECALQSFTSSSSSPLSSWEFAAGCVHAFTRVTYLNFHPITFGDLLCYYSALLG